MNLPQIEPDWQDKLDIIAFSYQLNGTIK